MTDPAGNLTTYTYDGNSNLLSQVETDKASGTTRTTTYTYDGLDRRTSETLDDIFVTIFSYDAVGNLIETAGPIQDPSGNPYTKLSTFDGVGRLLTVTDQGGYVTKYAYDAAG